MRISALSQTIIDHNCHIIKVVFSRFFLHSRLQDPNDTSAHKTRAPVQRNLVLIADFLGTEQMKSTFTKINWIFCLVFVKKSLSTSSIHSLSRLRRVPRGPEPCGGGEHGGGGVAPLGHGYHHEPDVGQHRHHVEQAQPGGHLPPRREAGRAGDVHQPGESGQHPPPGIHRRQQTGM